MSYDVYLEKDGEPCKVETHCEGGTYRVGGSFDAHLNITYNYSFFFYNFFDNEEGIRWLYGKKAKDCIERLSDAVKILGINQNDDYWSDTPGNAGYALNILLQWAKQHKEAVFDGD
jgi:hypothetical protein